MSDRIRKIIDLLSRSGYLKTGEASDPGGCLSFGPLALLVANNFRNEWFRTNVVNTDLPVSLYDSHHQDHWQADCQAAFSHALQATNEQLPFSLVSVVANHNCEASHNVAGPYSTPQSNFYRCLTFIDNKDSQQYFYRLQRKHKMWWRKFSTDPERFTITEERQNCIKISATFPWSTEVVESIELLDGETLAAHGSVFQVKTGRKRRVADVVSSVCGESAAVLTYLCDAHQPGRPLMRLHHALAPYKVAFALDPEDEQVGELGELASCLGGRIRRAGLLTLLPRPVPLPLPAQLSLHDGLAVPYTVVLAAPALNSGILGLRSRDTTLQEQVHVSKLTSYMLHLLSTPQGPS